MREKSERLWILSEEGKYQIEWALFTWLGFLRKNFHFFNFHTPENFLNDWNDFSFNKIPASMKHEFFYSSRHSKKEAEASNKKLFLFSPREFISAWHNFVFLKFSFLSFSLSREQNLLFTEFSHWWNKNFPLLYFYDCELWIKIYFIEKWNKKKYLWMTFSRWKKCSLRFALCEKWIETGFEMMEILQIF